MEYTGIRLCPAFSVDVLYDVAAVEYDSRLNFSGESHNMCEMIYILSGTLGVTSGLQAYECRPGELFLHPSNVFHTCRAMNGAPVRLMMLHFSGEGVDDVVPGGKFALTPFEKGIADLLLEKVVANYGYDFWKKEGYSPKDDQIVKGLLESLLCSLSQRRAENYAAFPDSSMRRFREIVAYMEKHVMDGLCVEDVCAACAIGRSALKSLFKRYTGSGVMKYYNYLRVCHAVLLMRQEKSMAKVAEEMSFSSQSAFSTFFRRETGMTPTAYSDERIRGEKSVGIVKAQYVDPFGRRIFPEDGTPDLYSGKELRPGQTQRNPA